MGQPLPAGRGRGIALIDYGTAMAQVAEVSVTGGKVRVHPVVVAANPGRMVNPNIVRQQLEGSIIFGLSAVLYGEVTLKDGRMQQTNFHDYPVVRMTESPAIDMHIVESEEKPAGIGEPGTALIGPAVANAVFAATGKRLRRLHCELASRHVGDRCIAFHYEPACSSAWRPTPEDTRAWAPPAFPRCARWRRWSRMPAPAWKTARRPRSRGRRSAWAWPRGRSGWWAASAPRDGRSLPRPRSPA